MNHLSLIITYIIIFNLIGFLVCGIDKSRAKRGLWRISERNLLLIGLCGGCFGLLLGMNMFRHKTKHIKFRILVPLECVLWIVAAVYFYSTFTQG